MSESVITFHLRYVTPKKKACLESKEAYREESGMREELSWKPSGKSIRIRSAAF
jgi:hypothetical protein